MATCKDCFHYDACKGILDAVGIEIDAECPNQETLCGNFAGRNLAKNTMTNADRIRAMSDEELARFLVENEWECETYNDCAKCPRMTDDGCVSLSKWLKQPAE